MGGTTSLLRTTTTALRIGATEHRSAGVVQKSTFARFLASFDFRLFRQYRPGVTSAASRQAVQRQRAQHGISSQEFSRRCRHLYWQELVTKELANEYRGAA